MERHSPLRGSPERGRSRYRSDLNYRSDHITAQTQPLPVSEATGEPSHGYLGSNQAKRKRSETEAWEEPSYNCIRVQNWVRERSWPNHEKTMQRFQDNYVAPLARRRSPSSGQKKSAGSLAADTDDHESTPEKNSYRTGQVEKDLAAANSFMIDHAESVTEESKRLCLELLNTARTFDEPLFSDEVYPGLCEMVAGQNEATVVRYLLPRLVPSGPVRALRGAKHLGILCETNNASWINAMRCAYRRPQPDYALGFRRAAFKPEQLEKLEPYLGTRVDDESMFAATYDTCFPFLTAEVNCRDAALVVADRQNAVSQTVGLRGLVELFRTVGRVQELHRQIMGWSISHNDTSVRIYGHYVFITNENITYHRFMIDEFPFVPIANGDHRWKTPTFIENLHDLWAVKHFERICSAVDMLPSEGETL